MFKSVRINLNARPKSRALWPAWVGQFVALIVGVAPFEHPTGLALHATERAAIDDHFCEFLQAVVQEHYVQSELDCCVLITVWGKRAEG